MKPRLMNPCAAVGIAVICCSLEATAQMPGLPVLQNAFTNRGLAFAGNFGSGGGQSAVGAAAAWGLGRGEGADGRLVLSAGAAAQRANEATRGVYGARAAARLWSSRGGALGAGAFVGFGGAPRTTAGTQVTNPAVVNIPAGVSVAYRRAVGEKRGLSVYVSPFYSWSRAEVDTVVTSGTVRFSAGFDFAFTRALGVTVGGEFGGKSKDAEGKSGIIGAAFSFVPGARR